MFLCLVLPPAYHRLECGPEFSTAVSTKRTQTNASHRFEPQMLASLCFAFSLRVLKSKMMAGKNRVQRKVEDGAADSEAKCGKEHAETGVI